MLPFLLSKTVVFFNYSVHEQYRVGNVDNIDNIGISQKFLVQKVTLKKVGFCTLIQTLKHSEIACKSDIFKLGFVQRYI